MVQQQHPGTPGGPEAYLAAWAALFDAGDYHAAHEVLEGAWHRTAGPERDLFKGLLHASVALYHHARGNAHGARTKAASARRYLQPFLPHAHHVDLAALLEAVDQRIAPLLRGHPTASGARPRVPWLR